MCSAGDLKVGSFAFCPYGVCAGMIRIKPIGIGHDSKTRTRTACFCLSSQVTKLKLENMFELMMIKVAKYEKCHWQIRPDKLSAYGAVHRAVCVFDLYLRAGRDLFEG